MSAAYISLYIIEQHSESSVMVFTADSVCNRPVGSGGCAAVVLAVCANEDIDNYYRCCLSVGTKVSSEQSGL